MVLAIRGDGGDCPVHFLNARPNKSFLADLTFQQFNRILSGSCAALACLISFTQIARHATHFSLPRQQVKLMRVISLVPMYAIVNFLIVCFPQADVYIGPILELLQALCLASYFMLLCEYISPHSEGRSGFFAQIEIRDRRSTGGVVQDGVKWFAQRCFSIFQYPLIALAIAIATIITQVVGVYCQYESTTKYARLWLQIILSISSGLAITSVLVVALQLRKHMPNLKPMQKLVAIKLVVGLGFIQSILFWILQSTNSLNETDTLTYADLHYGIPSLLSCIEMVPISFVVIWAYPVGPYKLKNMVDRQAERGEELQDYTPSAYQGGLLGIRAFIDMLNPSDVVEATIAAFSVAGRNYSAFRFNLGDKTYATSGPSYQEVPESQYPPSDYRQSRGNGYNQTRGESYEESHQMIPSRQHQR